jgi:hypothetical protein
MQHPQTLPSPLKIAAEIDAALAESGLAGPQVEREAIPLYLSFVEDMIDVEGENRIIFKQTSPRDIAKSLSHWAQDQGLTQAGLILALAEPKDEVLLLCGAHGTLTDMKRRKFLNFHQQIIDFIPLLMGHLKTATNQGL